MSTTTRFAAPSSTPRDPAMPDELRIGDRLSQREFHELYSQHDDKTIWELIDGVVYMASPLFFPHGSIHMRVSGIVWVYSASTPGLLCADNTTTVLSAVDEVQPDLWVALPPELGGRAKVATADGAQKWLEGPPELLVEVSATTRAIDLHAKRDSYLKTGVGEYLVFVVGDKELRAWELTRNVPIPVDADGIWRSRRFPGLWIDVAAVFACDDVKSMTAVQQGIASPEHAQFVAELEARRKQP